MSFTQTALKISVLIPVFNSEEYLSRCLDSVLNQSYTNYEIICIDDGSSDSSPIILKDYSKRYPGTFVIEHQKNAGVACARNRAIDLATGDYIVFADNDDWFDSDFFEILLNEAVYSKADVVCSGYKRPNSEGKIITSVIPRPNDEWGPYAVGAAWAKMYRLSFVREHSFVFLNTNISEDLYFTLPSIELAKKISVIPYCGYNWFYNEASVSNTVQRSSENLLFSETLDSLFYSLADRNVLINPILVHYFIRLIVWFLFYTRKGDGSSLSEANLDLYRNWLDSKINGWEKDIYASPFRPYGDALANRFAVWLFVRHPSVFAFCLHLYGR